MTKRRKRTIPDDYQEILWRYIRCEIGKSECKNLLGLSESNKLSDNGWYSEFLKTNGIRKIRNNIDTKAWRGTLRAGAIVGFNIYDDGRKALMYWRG